MASNAKNASIWWRHHGKYLQVTKMTSMCVEQSYRGVSYTTMTTTIGLNKFIWFTAQLWYTYIMSYLIYNFSWQVDKMPTWPWCCRSLSVFLLVSTLTPWTFDGYFYFLFVSANKICLDNLLHKYHFEENNVLERKCYHSRIFVTDCTTRYQSGQFQYFRFSEDYNFVLISTCFYYVFMHVNEYGKPCARTVVWHC